MDYKTAHAIANQYVERVNILFDSPIYDDLDNEHKRYLRRTLISEGYELIALFVNNNCCPTKSQANPAMNKIAIAMSKVLNDNPEV